MRARRAGSGAEAAEVLRWKFKPGETLRFSIEQKFTMSMKSSDTERKSTRTETEEISWKVVGVSPAGEAEITHRIDRIRMRVEAPPFMPFDFDTASTKEIQSGFEAESKMLKSRVGVEFTFKMKPTGEILDIKVSEAALKAMREAAPPGGPEGEISEKALKDMLLQSSAPAFPAEPLEPGKTWSPKPGQVPLPFGTMVLDKKFTYQGPDPKSPNLQLVGIENTARIEPREGADIKVVLRKQEGSGSMTFDVNAGRVVNTRQNLRVNLGITLMGQAMEQSTDTVMSMTLLP